MSGVMPRANALSKPESTAKIKSAFGRKSTTLLLGRGPPLITNQVLSLSKVLPIFPFVIYGLILSDLKSARAMNKPTKDPAVAIQKEKRAENPIAAKSNRNTINPAVPDSGYTKHPKFEGFELRGSN